VRRLSQQNDANNNYETGKQQLVIVTLCVIIYTYNYIIAGACGNYRILVRSGCLHVSDYCILHHNSAENQVTFWPQKTDTTFPILIKGNLVFDLQAFTQRTVSNEPVTIAN